MLKWDETDFISALEVLPEVDEYKTSHRFVVEQDGLRLVLTLEQYSGDVDFTLYRDGIEMPLFSMHIFDCPTARCVKDKNREFIEFEPSKALGNRWSDVDLRVGVRLTANPHIRIEIF